MCEQKQIQNVTLYGALSQVITSVKSLTLSDSFGDEKLENIILHMLIWPHTYQNLSILMSIFGNCILKQKLK
jgi:hypothetical protein